MTASDELTCRDLVELVTDYLDGVLAAQLHARFEAHLRACDGCAAYLEQMRSTLRVLAMVPVEVISRRTRHRLVAAFRTWAANIARRRL
jgi:anti-sigma factor RsiW